MTTPIEHLTRNSLRCGSCHSDDQCEATLHQMMCCLKIGKHRAKRTCRKSKEGIYWMINKITQTCLNKLDIDGCLRLVCCWSANAAQFATGRCHANTIDAIVIEAIVLIVEIITEMGSTPCTTNLALSLQAQVYSGVALEDTIARTTVADIRQSIFPHNWWRVEAWPWPICSRFLVELHIWLPQWNTTACTTKNTLRIFIVRGL